MPIYTKTGDKGTAALFNNARVSKAHIRLQTYGDIDELNSLLGVVLAELNSPRHSREPRLPAGRSGNPRFRTSRNDIINVHDDIVHIQQDLFAIGAVFANPTARIDSAFLEHLVACTKEFEQHIDTMTATLPPLKNFILPGGSLAGSFLQYARAVSRRVERRAVALHEKETVSPEVLQYLNRLSDLLFTMSRFVNQSEGIKEVIWKS